MLPLEKVRAATAAKMAEEDPLFLQYGYISGYPLFRQVLAKFLAEGYGKGVCRRDGAPRARAPIGRTCPSSRRAPHRCAPAEVDPELLFATNGISGTLGLLCSLFVSRGDVIVVEEPSYFLALSIFRDFGLTIVPVGIDDDGLKTEELEAKLAGGLRPAVVYTIPAFHNPTAVCLSADRKRHLVALARKYDFMVWADEVYQLLGFTGESLHRRWGRTGWRAARCSGCCCTGTSTTTINRNRAPACRAHCCRHPAPSSAGVPAPSAPLCYFDEEAGGGEGAGRVISMGSFAKILAPAM